MKLVGGTDSGFSTRDLLVLLAKLAVTVGLVALFLSRQSFQEIKDVLHDPHWGWLAAALGVYAISAFGGALQWAWILKATGIVAPPLELLRLYFIGLFFNNFLPANIGGDTYKIVDLGRRENRPMGVFCSTLLDRLIGLTALTALAVVFLTLAAVRKITLPASSLLLIPITLALVALLALLLSRRLGTSLPALFHRWGWQRLANGLSGVTSELAIFRSRVRWLNLIFLFSLVVQFLRMATHLLVAFGLGLVLNLEQMIQLLVLVPMLALSLTLPITINGIGLRESVAAQLLVFCGLAASEVVAMEGVAYLVQMVFSLLGGVLLWQGRAPADAEATEN